MTQAAARKKIEVTKDGPYLVTGRVPLAQQTIGVNAQGESASSD